MGQLADVLQQTGIAKWRRHYSFCIAHP
jgi:hypothetical protein